MTRLKEALTGMQNDISCGQTAGWCKRRLIIKDVGQGFYIVTQYQ